MSVPVPTTPTNPDLREQVANALADSNLREVGDDGTLVRPFAAKSPMAFAYADAALTVVAPVLEGLRAERDRERESRIAWALEADRLQQEREALSSLLRGMARRVGQKREEIRELAAHLPCGWCNGTGIAPEESFGHDGDGAPMVDGDQPCPEGCRPYASDPGDLEHLRAILRGESDWTAAPSSVQGDTTPTTYDVLDKKPFDDDGEADKEEPDVVRIVSEREALQVVLAGVLHTNAHDGDGIAEACSFECMPLATELIEEMEAAQHLGIVGEIGAATSAPSEGDHHA